jgi:hypothetical protein
MRKHTRQKNISYEFIARNALRWGRVCPFIIMSHPLKFVSKIWFCVILEQNSSYFTWTLNPILSSFWKTVYRNKVCRWYKIRYILHLGPQVSFEIFWYVVYLTKYNWKICTIQQHSILRQQILGIIYFIWVPQNVKMTRRIKKFEYFCPSQETVAL